MYCSSFFIFLGLNGHKKLDKLSYVRILGKRVQAMGNVFYLGRGILILDG